MNKFCYNRRPEPRNPRGSGGFFGGLMKALTRLIARKPKQAACLAAILFVFAIFFASNTLLQQQAELAPAPVENVAETLPEPEQPAPVAQEEPLTFVSGNFNARRPFYNQMIDQGMTPVQIHNLVAALKPVYDFRRAHPKHEWELGKVNDEIQQFTIKVSAAEIYDVEKVLTEPDVTRRPIETFEVEHIVRAKLNGSLFNSLVDEPGSAQLAMKLARVFAWDIDFYQDPREGDSFEILVSRTYIRGENGAVFFEYGPIKAARYFNGRNTFTAYRYAAKDNQWEYYDEKGNSLIRDVLRSPLKFQRITSSYSKRRFHPTLKTYRAHNGVDYGAPKNTPVMAVSSGKVVRAGRYGGAGIAVEIQHSNKMLTQYFHLNKIARHIKKGTRVRQGEVIGYVGKTGYATGYHLHFGMKIRGKYVNPLRQKFRPGTPIPAKLKDAFEEQMDVYLARLEQPIRPERIVPLVRNPSFFEAARRESVPNL